MTLDKRASMSMRKDRSKGERERKKEKQIDTAKELQSGRTLDKKAAMSNLCVKTEEKGERIFQKKKKKWILIRYRERIAHRDDAGRESVDEYAQRQIQRGERKKKQKKKNRYRERIADRDDAGRESVDEYAQ